MPVLKTKVSNGSGEDKWVALTSFVEQAYIQEDEPFNPKNGDLWINTSAHPEGFIPAGAIFIESVAGLQDSLDNKENLIPRNSTAPVNPTNGDIWLDESLDNVTVAGIFDFNAIISTEWENTNAPYKQEIVVNGLRVSDKPFADLMPSTNYSIAEKEIEDYTKIYNMVTFDNKLIVYSSDITEVNLNIQLRCFR